MSAQHRRRVARKRGGPHLEIDYGWLMCWSAGRNWIIGNTDPRSSMFVGTMRGWR